MAPFNTATQPKGNFWHVDASRQVHTFNTSICNTTSMFCSTHVSIPLIHSTPNYLLCQNCRLWFKFLGRKKTDLPQLQTLPHKSLCNTILSSPMCKTFYQLHFSVCTQEDWLRATFCYQLLMQTHAELFHNSANELMSSSLLPLQVMEPTAGQHRGNILWPHSQWGNTSLAPQPMQLRAIWESAI